MSEHRKDDLKTAYQQVCEGYRAIDDMRTKLLGLLPLATGAGVLVLSGRGSTAYRPHRRLQPAMISFDRIIGVPRGHVRRRRDQFVDHPQVRAGLVGGHLDR